METRKTWDLRGPVHTCVLERTWSGRSDSHSVEFRLDGQIASTSVTNHDGSGFTTIYSYDETGRLVSSSCRDFSRFYRYDAAGRLAEVTVQSPSRTGVVETYEYAPDGSKKKTVQLGPSPANCSFQVEGGEAGYPAPGAVAMVTLYTTTGKPLETQFLDENGSIVNRIVLRYDERGLVVEESSIQSANSMLARIPVDQMDPGQIEMLRSVFANAARTLYHYDERGRRIKKETTMFGGMMETTEAISYNESDDPVSHAFEEHNKTGEPSSRRFESRTLYEYDSHGNWLIKSLEDGSNVETRRIAYWPDRL